MPKAATIEEISDDNRHLKKRLMLIALAETGNVTAAARAAKIHRTNHYNWLNDDPEYAKAAKDAMDAASDLLEGEARRRAYTGVLEPVYQGGEKVGTIRRYSDTLLIFLLKGAKPDKYKERGEIKHSGGVAVSPVDLSKLSESQLEALEGILSTASDNGSDT